MKLKHHVKLFRLYGTVFLMSEGIKTPWSDCQAAKCTFGTAGAIFLEHLSIKNVNTYIKYEINQIINGK